MNCKACGKSHYGFCTDKSVPLSKRLAAPVWVDGDRISDYAIDALCPSAHDPVIREIKAMERKLKAIESEEKHAD